MVVHMLTSYVLPGETKPARLVATGPLPLRFVSRRLCAPLAAYVVLVERLPFHVYQPLVLLSNSLLAMRFGPTPLGALKTYLSTLTPPLNATKRSRSPLIG